MSPQKVMPRDASWFNHPNTSAPKKYHIPSKEKGVYGLTVAICSSHIVLATDMAVDRATVSDSSAMCQRCKKITGENDVP